MKNSRQLSAAVLIFSAVTLLFLLAKYGFNRSNKEFDGKFASLKSFNPEAAEKNAFEELSEGQQKYLETLQLTNSPSDTALFPVIANFWDSVGRADLSAWYYDLQVKSFPSNRNFEMAGSSWIVLFNSPDSTLRAYAASRAEEIYAQLTKTDTSNLEYQAMLAWSIVQNRERVMDGVTLLRKVQAVDSNHVGSLYMLGLLSLESGQYDLAIKRFKKLLSLQPFNQEYPLLYASALYKSGRATEAGEFLNNQLGKTTDLEFQKEIRQLMETMK